MNRSFACVGVMLLLLLATGCRSSVFTPELGSHFHLPHWAGGPDPVPELPEELAGKTTTSEGATGDDSRSLVPRPIPDSPGTPAANAKKVSPVATGSLAKNLDAGKAAFLDGRLSDARRAFQQVLDEDPRQSLAHHRLAIIADRNHDFPTADGHYQAACDADPNNANLLSDFGYSKLLRRDLEGSEVLLRKALALAPSNQHALNNLGLLQAKRGDYRGALATFRKVGSEAEAEKKIAVLFPQGHPGLPDRPDPARLANSQSTIPGPTATPVVRPVEDNPLRPVIPAGNEQPAITRPEPPLSTAAPTVESLDDLGSRSAATLPAQSLSAAGIPDAVNPEFGVSQTAARGPTPKAIPATSPVSGPLAHRPQIDPSLSRAAATLGLTIGPGQLVVSPSTDIPATPITPLRSLGPRNRSLAPPVTGPAAAPPAASSSVDPLGDFEDTFRNDTSRAPLAQPGATTPVPKSRSLP